MASSSQSSQEYYDILLLGRTGMGKSTTGNKLLGLLGGSARWSVEEHSEDYFRTAKEDGVVADSVTTECKVLSNALNVRVLDTPGFADSRTTKELGVLKGNLQIFRCILREQKQRNLTFRRVLYFLPNRGSPERAEGTLQEEIRVMYDFFGQDIFNIMVLIATNRKKHQMNGFDEEDKKTTREIFSKAYERVAPSTLPRCPPIRYLKFAEADLLNIIVNADVILDKPISKPVVIDAADETQIRNAISDNPGRRLQFQDRCARCADKIIYEHSKTGPKAVTIVNERGDECPYEETKCHPVFIPKHYQITKVLGGIGHIATLGVFAGIGYVRGKPIWPGFTNSQEICPQCEKSPGSDGCLPVNNRSYIPTKGGKKEPITVSHTSGLDDVQI